jgi:hypothetical protein
MVEELRRQFEKERGEPEALLHAIDYCARAGIPMPEWLAQAWADRFENWVLFRVNTLDKAFDVQREGKQLKVQRRNARLRPFIVSRVLQLSAEGVRPIKKAFDRVAAEIIDDGDESISGSTVREIYYERASNGWRRFFKVLARMPNEPPGQHSRKNT